MKKTYLLLFVSSLIFFIAGFFTYRLFFELVVPENENLQIIVTNLSGEFWRPIYFSLFIGLIPIAIYLPGDYAGLRTLKPK